eukprot:g20488.t1
MAAVLHLDDLVEATEQTDGLVKYVAKHRVVGRAKIQRLLNPSALFELNAKQEKVDYLRADAEILPEEDPMEPLREGTAEALAEAWETLRQLSEKLSEPSLEPRFGDPEMLRRCPAWRLAEGWYRLRTKVQAHREHARVGTAVNAWLQEEKRKGNGIAPAEALQQMPPQLLEVVTRLNSPSGPKFGPQFSEPFLRLLGSSGKARDKRLVEMANQEVTLGHSGHPATPRFDGGRTAGESPRPSLARTTQNNMKAGNGGRPRGAGCRARVRRQASPDHFDSRPAIRDTVRRSRLAAVEAEEDVAVKLVHRLTSQSPPLRTPRASGGVKNRLQEECRVDSELQTPEPIARVEVGHREVEEPIVQLKDVEALLADFTDELCSLEAGVALYFSQQSQEVQRLNGELQELRSAFASGRRNFPEDLWAKSASAVQEGHWVAAGAEATAKTFRLLADAQMPVEVQMPLLSEPPFRSVGRGYQSHHQLGSLAISNAGEPTTSTASTSVHLLRDEESLMNTVQARIAEVARSFTGQSSWPGRFHATVELRFLEEVNLIQESLREVRRQRQRRHQLLLEAARSLLEDLGCEPVTPQACRAK